jgi:hypothetical protein
MSQQTKRLIALEKRRIKTTDRPMTFSEGCADRAQKARIENIMLSIMAFCPPLEQPSFLGCMFCEEQFATDGDTHSPTAFTPSMALVAPESVSGTLPTIGLGDCHNINQFFL